MFTLTIETRNAAFDGDPGPELARLLREAARLVEDGYTSGYPRDYNGNAVGHWSLDANPPTPGETLQLGEEN